MVMQHTRNALISNPSLSGPSSHLGPKPQTDPTTIRGLDHATASDVLRPGPAPKHGPRPAALDTLQSMLAAVKQAQHRIQFASKAVSARDLSALAMAAKTLALYATAISTKGWDTRWVHAALATLRQARALLAVEDELEMHYPRTRPASITRQTKALQEVSESLEMAEGVLTCNAGFKPEVTGTRDA